MQGMPGRTNLIKQKCRTSVITRAMIPNLINMIYPQKLRYGLRDESSFKF